MLVGAAWAGLVALLKVTRGVSEVISSIMLNFIATGLIAFLMRPSLLGVRTGSNDITTKPIPGSGQVQGLDLISGAGTKVFGLIVLAAVVGIAFQVVDRQHPVRLRPARGRALAAGGPGQRRQRHAHDRHQLLASGAIAGLVGLPILLGDSHSYSAQTFPSGFGFTGIAIALLGRNNPVGIAFAALLWSFLDQSATILDLNGIPKEIVQITQGVVVLSVVVAYEVVRRVALRAAATPGRARAGHTAPPPAPPTEGGAPSLTKGATA